MAEITEQTDVVTMDVTKEGNWYLAQGRDLSIFTEAETLEELKEKIREAITLHLSDGENGKYGLPPTPTVKVVYRFEETL
jgi:predicted RNase H-like HicB family nuclease